MVAASDKRLGEADARELRCEFCEVWGLQLKTRRCARGDGEAEGSKSKFKPGDFHFKNSASSLQLEAPC